MLWRSVYHRGMYFIDKSMSWLNVCCGECMSLRNVCNEGMYVIEKLMSWRIVCHGDIYFMENCI